MHPPDADTVVVRYGELGMKSPAVRGRMEERLVENLEAKLTARDISGDVERHDARLFVHTESAATAAAAAAETFGVVSASPAVSVVPTMDAIQDALARAAEACYDGGAFAVDARRSTDDLPFDTRDLNEEGGRAVWEAVEEELDPVVDLDDPDVTFNVEARRDNAFVFTEIVDGPGGLPLGTQEPVVALLSGGIDSPVAAYEMMRRGSPVIPVYVELGDYGGPDHLARAVESVRTLAGYAPNFDMRPYLVEGGETVAMLAETMERGRMLSLRRYMLRVGERIAELEDASGVVTGEALGQKSSQTGRNLAVTSAATDLPVHRPLLNEDKPDITERAKDIGTFEDATIEVGCNRVAPARPETNGRLSRLLELEPDDLFDRAEADAEAADRLVLEP